MRIVQAELTPDDSAISLSKSTVIGGLQLFKAAVYDWPLNKNLQRLSKIVCKRGGASSIGSQLFRRIMTHIRGFSKNAFANNTLRWDYE